MLESFLVRLQLCFGVSFVPTAPGLEKGVMFSGKALEQVAGILIWTPGTPGKHTLDVDIWLISLLGARTPMGLCTYSSRMLMPCSGPA